jgi:membrane protease subunit HflK
MKVDFHTFKRAVGVSVAGLVLQVVLGAILLIYGVLGKDPTAFIAAAYAGFGVLMWLALAIVFDQQKRERIEAIEAESLAQQQAGTSVFGGGDAGEFRVAAKRLAGLQRWFVPAWSVVLGLGMIGAGIYFFLRARAGMAIDANAAKVPLPPLTGWALGVGLSVAVIGFIFARYASGMAKQKVWSNLRGGGAAAVGTALLGLLIAAGQFVRLAGQDIVLLYAPMVASGFLVFVGAETLLNFLLDLYRPRKAGEVQPPAFESRLLGFVAAPDRIAKSVSDAINYQLGFDVSGSWFYRLLSTWVVPLVFGALLVFWLLTSLVVVRPHQRALVLHWGSVDRELEPGLHVKYPWPIEVLQIPEYRVMDEKGKIVSKARTTTGIRTIDLGTPSSAATGPILWTNEHARDEVYQIVQPSRDEGTKELAGVKDLALVALELPLSYIVTDLRLFEELGPPEVRDDMLRGVARRELVREMAHVTVDDVLGAGRLALADRLQAVIQSAYDRMNHGPDGKARGAGIQVVSFGIAGVHPPTAVAPNFEAVVQAQSYREAKIESARKDAIEKLTKVVGSVELADKIVAELDALEKQRESKAAPGAVAEQEFKVQKLLEQAGGSAASLIAKASADRWTRHMSERGRAARYRGQLASYQASPVIYKSSLYFEAMRTVLKDSRLFITDDGVRDLRLNWQGQDKESVGTTFNPEELEEAGKK